MYYLPSITFAPSSFASSAAPVNCTGSFGASDVLVSRAAGVFVSIEGSTTTAIFRSNPTTSINALRRITSDSDRSKLSFAPALTMPMVIAFSSTDRTCALADSSDQVSLRRFYTSSITSGHARLSTAISKLPGTFGAAAGADSFALAAGTTSSALEGATAGFE